jgi:hypothetical protein
MVVLGRLSVMIPDFAMPGAVFGMISDCDLEEERL